MDDTSRGVGDEAMRGRGEDTTRDYSDTEGTRSTELARRAAISKQAAGKTLRELEDAGLLERAPDERDGRATLVRLTGKGLELLVETHRAVEQVEREYDSGWAALSLRPSDCSSSRLDRVYTSPSRCS